MYPAGFRLTRGGYQRGSAMRTRSVFLIAMLSAAVVLPETSHAQFSPQGLLNGITRPFRSMLGHFGHSPRHRRHEAATVDRSMAEASRPNAVSPSASSRLGRGGPPAWPSAFEDVLGYTFWPDDYAQRLRGHGFDVISDTITGSFETPRAPVQASTTGSAVRDDANAGSACPEAAGVQDNWPSTRFGQTIQLTNAQHDAVDAIQKAVRQSKETLKSDCADVAALPAPDRLRALVQSLWTVHDAGVALRAPVKQFEDALTPAQKASFASRMPAAAPKPDAKNQNAANQNAAMNRQYQACAAPNVEEAERLIKQIEMRVRPTKEQAASLENLHKITSDMAKLLMASCARPIPKEPVERLDAANDQLTTLNYAATTLQIAFNDFYSKLDNAQKARFDSPGR